MQNAEGWYFWVAECWATGHAKFWGLFYSDYKPYTMTQHPPYWSCLHLQTFTAVSFFFFFFLLLKTFKVSLLTMHAYLGAFYLKSVYFILIPYISDSCSKSLWLIFWWLKVGMVSRVSLGSPYVWQTSGSNFIQASLIYRMDKNQLKKKKKSDFFLFKSDFLK